MRALHAAAGGCSAVGQATRQVLPDALQQARVRSMKLIRRFPHSRHESLGMTCVSLPVRRERLQPARYGKIAKEHAARLCSGKKHLADVPCQVSNISLVCLE